MPKPEEEFHLQFSSEGQEKDDPECYVETDCDSSSDSNSGSNSDWWRIVYICI